MKTDQFDFGRTKNNEAVFGYCLENSRGVSIKVINYGATLISVKTPDRNGKIEEIILGYQEFSDYETHSPYFGSTVGRVGNRIKSGIFKIGEEKFQLAKNEKGLHHLHGGEKGFARSMWQLTLDDQTDKASIVCSYLSVDGEDNYPGNLQTKVTYSLTEQNELIIDYQAQTDKPCPVNLTNHAYWNLSGNKKKSVLDHVLTLNCSHFLPIDQELIPSGEIKAVENTPWDFREPKRMGEEIEAIGGYDHCFVLQLQKGACKPAAEVFEPVSGRKLEIETTEPGVQFYSGNFLHLFAEQGFKKHDGFCLETQMFPDSMNHDNFPAVLLYPGEQYVQRTIHRFCLSY